MTLRTFTLLATSAFIIAACATPQENPHYEVSTKYKASSPYTQTAQIPQQQQVTLARYDEGIPNHAIIKTRNNTVTRAGIGGYAQPHPDCLKQERNRQLIGGGIGGTVGAVAGKKLIGGTAGTLAGAAIGGAAGYGIGDSTVNCDPVFVPARQSQNSQPGYGQNSYTRPQAQVYSNQSYASPQAYPAAQTYPVAQTQTAQAGQAPTDKEYGETFGTPGYHAIQSANGASNPAGQTSNVPTPVDNTAQYIPPAPNPIRPQPQRPIQPPVTQQSPVQSAPVQIAPQTAVPNTARPAYGGQRSHIVAKDDTVYSLSRSVCSDIETVRQMNNLGPNFAINIGQTLTLPASRC